jgi:hypothetical protein
MIDLNLFYCRETTELEDLKASRCTIHVPELLRNNEPEQDATKGKRRPKTLPPNFIVIRALTREVIRNIAAEDHLAREMQSFISTPPSPMVKSGLVYAIHP